jgi:hypothetical protein
MFIALLRSASIPRGARQDGGALHTFIGWQAVKALEQGLSSRCDERFVAEP